MKTQSAKAKGRRLQQQIRDAIIEAFPALQEDDVRSTSMGASGEDLLLSPLARRYFPFSPECKNQERLSIWKALKQAKSREHPGLLVFKRNRSKTYVALEFDTFLAFLKEFGQMKDCLEASAYEDLLAAE